MKLKSLIAAASIAALSAGMAYADAHGGKVKVGMITTLSGGGAGLGIDVRDGFMLAAKGNENLELVIEDDQRKPDIAVQLADKLIQSEKVDVLTGIIWSNLAMAVVPAATAQGKFYLSPNAGPSALAGKGCSPLYFNVAWQNDAFNEAAGSWASENDIKKVFLMAPNYPAGQDMIAGFKRTYTGEVVEEVYTKLGQTDYAAEIAQMRASDADTVYFFLPGGMGISFMKQYAGSGVDKNVMGPAFSFDQGILGAIGDAALGVKNTSHWSKDLDNEANVKFVADFQAEFGRLPSLYAAQGYDTALLLQSAMGKADVKDAAAFQAAMEEADFASVRGDFSFAPNHHPIQDIYMREVVKEGDVVTNKVIGVAASAHQDVYGADCKM
ncbi:ABC transporter substrate-binding protein [Roseobacter sp. GAI101]|uniref:ABC transporter substrate-binding protein n=1 Tax=Roseobacter sp. (strain GAI101) TaxID=391589 RepID=UPI00018721DF|nr:ABC transporter substrate-binding protein [Roseobacter sp. GAI101]EEB84523.1 ABC transporter substrate binding protein [Roseobacter sp. GAI101]